MKKLKRKNGETLAETLVSLVIISLALIMLPGAVVAAARVNAKVEKQAILMEKDKKSEDTTLTDVTITMNGTTGTLSNVKVTRFGSEENGLYEMKLKVGEE